MAFPQIRKPILAWPINHNDSLLPEKLSPPEVRVAAPATIMHKTKQPQHAERLQGGLHV